MSIEPELMKRKTVEYVFWLLLLLPLALIYVESTKDWGDDFAAYYTEAHNISEHRPYYESYFKFFDYNDHYAPPYYSVGFPLLLSPVVDITGLNTYRLNYYMSLWMLAWGMIVIWFLRRYFDVFSVFSFTVIFFLSPYFFQCKGRILADIPFSFFFLLSIALYTHPKQNRYKWIFTGIFMAMAILIRTIGFILLLSMVLEFFLLLSKKNTRDEWRMNLLKAAIVSLTTIVSIAICYAIFQTPFDGYYIRQFHATDISHITANTFTYLYSFSWFFTDLNVYSIRSVNVIVWILLIGLISGSIKKWTRPPDVISITFLGYLILIIVFPDTQGFRYLLPLVPFIIYFILHGILSITSVFRIRYEWGIALLVVVVMVMHSPYYIGMVTTTDGEIGYGPFTKESQRGFAEIKQIVPANALILSVWPRVVGLMTSRYCCAIPEGGTREQIKLLSMSHPDYALSILEHDPEVIDNIALAHNDSLIWENNGFRLYKCRAWMQ
jgi:hypothetical protein